jgi:hypothetical protein
MPNPNKLVDGKLVELTDEEVAARNADAVAFAAEQAARKAERDARRIKRSEINSATSIPEIRAILNKIADQGQFDIDEDV